MCSDQYCPSSSSIPPSLTHLLARSLTRHFSSQLMCSVSSHSSRKWPKTWELFLLSLSLSVCLIQDHVCFPFRKCIQHDRQVSRGILPFIELHWITTLFCLFTRNLHKAPFLHSTVGRHCVFLLILHIGITHTTWFNQPFWTCDFYANTERINWLGPTWVLTLRVSPASSIMLKKRDKGRASFYNSIMNRKKEEPYPIPT